MSDSEEEYYPEIGSRLQRIGLARGGRNPRIPNKPRNIGNLGPKPANLIKKEIKEHIKNLDKKEVASKIENVLYDKKPSLPLLRKLLNIIEYEEWKKNKRVQKKNE